MSRRLTNQELIVKAFKADGFKELEGYHSRRYIVFQGKKNPNTKFFIGKKGAVRVGKAVSTSTSLKVNFDKLRKRFEDE